MDPTTFAALMFGVPAAVFVALVALIALLTELCKQVTPAKLYPFVAYALGITLVLVYEAATTDITVMVAAAAVLTGLVAGATASGVYSQAKHIITLQPGGADEEPAAPLEEKPAA